MAAPHNEILGHVRAARAVDGAPGAAEAVADAALICLDLDAHLRRAWPLGPDSVVGHDVATLRNIWRRALAFLALHMPGALASAPYALTALGRPCAAVPAIADAPEHALDRIDTTEGRF